MINFDFPRKTVSKRVARAFLSSIEIFVAALLATTIIALIIGFRPVYIIGWSMEPKIHYHDVVVVSPVKSIDDIEIGDVITFPKKSKARVTHIVCKIDEEGIHTCPYANYIEDSQEDGTEVHSFDDVYGKVAFKSTVLGAIVSFLKIRENIIFLILICVAYFAIYFYFKKRPQFELD